MKQTQPEILAPAGSFESLEAAVRCGATAIYLGGNLFSARASAKNFTNEDLKQAVAYCHARNVRVHLAINTLLLEKELPLALEFAKFACSLPVDAIIVQDVGLLSLLQTAAPSLPIHASTQMSVHAPAGAKLLAENGVSRVVLSRELSLSEISEISEVLKTSTEQAEQTELEHFVHGALCMSVSGQCYFSSILGSRSGNRGQCAQTCRLPFESPGGTGHDLSLKDLSIMNHIDELSSAGIHSLKIEGRMKRAEYVAAATSACAASTKNGVIPADLTESLDAVFSRSGFTSGYLTKSYGKEMFGIRTKENEESSSNAVYTKLRTLYKDELQSVPISFELSIQPETPFTLTVQDEDGHTVSAVGEIPQQAVNRAIDQTRCREQLNKTGGTPFFVTHMNCDIAENLSIPVSALNKLRRTVTEELLLLRSNKPAIPFTSSALPISGNHPHSPEPLPLRAMFSRVPFSQSIPHGANICSLIYIPIDTKEAVIKELQERGLPLAVTLPRGMFGTEEKLRAQLIKIKELGITTLWAGNISSVALAKELNFEIHGGFSLNITNTAALEWYESLGLTDTEVSFELTLRQIANLGGTLNRGLLLYGRLPLMLTRNCPAANNPDFCKTCGGTTYLKDRKGIFFPLQCSGGCTQVLNSVPLQLSDRYHEISHVDFGVLQFTVENSVEVEEILKQYVYHLQPNGSYTRGLYEKGIK